MVGDPADAIIADAYAFGARDFDTQKALQRDGHRGDADQQRSGPARPTRDVYGYLPDDLNYGCCNFYGPVSTQLEYDTRRLRHRLARQLAGQHQRLHAVRHPRPGLAEHLQPGHRVRAGQAGRTASGFPASRPCTSTGMVEGTASQYTPMVPFNLEGPDRGQGRQARPTVSSSTACSRRSPPQRHQRRPVQRAQHRDSLGVRLHRAALADAEGGARGAAAAVLRRSRSGSSATTTSAR